MCCGGRQPSPVEVTLGAAMLASNVLASRCDWLEDVLLCMRGGGTKPGLGVPGPGVGAGPDGDPNG